MVNVAWGRVVSVAWGRVVSVWGRVVSVAWARVVSVAWLGPGKARRRPGRQRGPGWVVGVGVEGMITWRGRFPVASTGNRPP